MVVMKTSLSDSEMMSSMVPGPDAERFDLGDALGFGLVFGFGFLAFDAGVAGADGAPFRPPT